jgi:chromosome segregation ATPase
VDQEANVRYEKTLEDLNLAHDRVKALESELELKTTELNAALNAIQQARSKEDELEESYVEKNQLEELVEKLTSQLDGLQDDLDLKIQELNEVQGAKQEVLLRNEVLDADVEQKKLEINQAQAELVEVRLKLEATGAELERAKQDLQESCARTEELVRMNEQLEREKKDAVASKETIEEELRINADAALEKARLSMDAVHRNDSEVHALQDSLEKTRSQAQHLQSSNEELLSELNLAKTKIDDLYNDLQSANAALSALNEEAASRNQDYSAELDRKTQAIQQLEVTLKETKLQLTELQSMQEVVQTELNESKRRIIDLEENLESECDARVAVQRATAEAASVAAVALHANVEEKEKIDRELLEYRERVARLTLELSHSTSALESAKAEVLQLENSSRTERVPREELHALTSELKEALQRVFQL